MTLIKSNNIFMDRNFTTLKEVMDFLSEQAIALGISDDQEAIYKSLIKREAEGSTGMMEGFAIPHAKDSSIKHTDIVIIQLNKKIEWESLDGVGIDFVIALFVPDSDAGTTHLKLLSQVARLLLHKDVTNGLKRAQSAEEIEKLLNEKLEEN
ncbi:PTS sugar transporter subunit IIA [Enterococcus hirae]|uniref:PTS sugar transporter subunit IIA n=1 Tax=Enterococcus hirae TaxID=1354 RepID=UPI0010A43085|nr:fructose PTS transporter subunit IIA [Enterococcus hirae]MBO1117464.1 PTS fructose transporter subunit IIA [Enterococcus hirae]THE13522.1 PTS fructose transporter subunit IIA [Enterococcus hirae]